MRGKRRAVAAAAVCLALVCAGCAVGAAARRPDEAADAEVEVDVDARDGDANVLGCAACDFHVGVLQCDAVLLCCGLCCAVVCCCAACGVVLLVWRFSSLCHKRLLCMCVCVCVCLRTCVW